MEDKSRISLEYLKEFTEEELWAELKRRKWEAGGIWSGPFIMDDGSLNMGVQDKPGTMSSVSWDSAVNWALLATRCEYVIDTRSSVWKECVIGDKEPYVYRKVLDERGGCHTHYVGPLADPRVQALLLLQPLGYDEQSEVIQWDVWRAPRDTDFKRWTQDTNERVGLPIAAELYSSDLPDWSEASSVADEIKGDGSFTFIRLSKHREELWRAILRERAKTSLYEDW